MAQTRNDDAPRTLREVGYLLSAVREDIQELRDGIKELKEVQKKITSTLIVSVVCPLVVGGILAFIVNRGL